VAADRSGVNPVREGLLTGCGVRLRRGGGRAGHGGVRGGADPVARARPGSGGEIAAQRDAGGLSAGRRAGAGGVGLAVRAVEQRLAALYSVARPATAGAGG
jgi:hypothetical protein